MSRLGGVAVSLALLAYGCTDDSPEAPTGVRDAADGRARTDGGGLIDSGADGQAEPAASVLYDDCTASEPVYDEAYTNLRAAQQEGREMADPARAPMLTSPAEGESIPALGSPPTFRWTYPGTARVSGPKDVRAHGCTVIGDVFWMRLTLPGGETLHVLNLNTDWTADEATWTKIKPTGGSTPPGCVGRRAHAVEPHHRGSLPWRRAHLARALTDLRESHPSRPRPVDV